MWKAGDVERQPRLGAAHSRFPLEPGAPWAIPHTSHEALSGEEENPRGDGLDAGEWAGGSGGSKWGELPIFTVASTFATKRAKVGLLGEGSWAEPIGMSTLKPSV